MSMTKEDRAIRLVQKAYRRMQERKRKEAELREKEARRRRMNKNKKKASPGKMVRAGNVKIAGAHHTGKASKNVVVR